MEKGTKEKEEEEEDEYGEGTKEGKAGKGKESHQEGHQSVEEEGRWALEIDHPVD